MKIFMGDLNAKVGAENTNRELILGRHDSGEQNKHGETFTVPSMTLILEE
jgi:hypothetical protein